MVNTSSTSSFPLNKTMILPLALCLVFWNPLQAASASVEPDNSSGRRQPQQAHTQPQAQEVLKPHRRRMHHEHGIHHHNVHFPHHGDKLDRHLQNGAMLECIEAKFQPFASEQEKQQYLQHVATVAECDKGTRLFPEEEPQYEIDATSFGLDLWYQFCNCGRAHAYQQTGQGAHQAISNVYEGLSLDGPRAFHLQTMSPNFAVTTFGMDDKDAPAGALSSSSNLRGGRSSQRQGQRQLYQTNDPFAGQLGHYDLINVAQAVDMVDFANAKDVVVHILDTGWEVDHEDLATNTWENPADPCNGIDDDKFYGEDCNGFNHANRNTNMKGKDDHGSHCAGTIAALADNGKGIAGIAGGKNGQRGVSIMPGLGFGVGLGGGFAPSIQYAANRGAKISSHSWGYNNPGAYDISVLDAIDYAEEKGMVVVAAAGNKEIDDWYPAYYEGAIAVAATTWQGNSPGAAVSGYTTNGWWGTNYGSWVDISAPGLEIYSSVWNNQYKSKSGTSMACPHVSGVLALGLVHKPSATPDELRTCLFDTATDLNVVEDKFVGKMGHGLVDAAGFLNCLTEPTTPDESINKSEWVVATNDTFHSDDLGTWTDPSSDYNVFLSKNQDYNCGEGSNNAVRIRNGQATSAIHSDPIAIAGYDELNLAFSFFSRSMDDNFSVRLKYEGRDWTTVDTVNEFNNGACNTYNKTFAIDSSQSTVSVMIRTNGDRNLEQIWVDDIVTRLRSYGEISSIGSGELPTTEPTVSPTPAPTSEPTVSPTPAPTSESTPANEDDPSEWMEESMETFADGLSAWNDPFPGNYDAFRSGNVAFRCGGGDDNFSIRIRNQREASHIYSNPFEIAGMTQARLKFDFYARNLNLSPNDSFKIEIMMKENNVWDSEWTSVATESQFSDGCAAYDGIFTISDYTSGQPTDMKFKIQMNTERNDRQMFVDNVAIMVLK